MCSTAIKPSGCTAANIFRPNGEKIEMNSLCALSLRVMEEALEILEKGNYMKLDGQLGNYSCEALAYRLFTIVSNPAFVEECRNLQRRIEAIKSNPIMTEEEFQTIEISEEMAFVLRARLLTIVKRVYYEIFEGQGKNYLTETTEITKLLKIVPEFNSGKVCQKIVKAAQIAMANSSIAFMRTEIAKATSLDEGSRAFLQTMFEEDQIRIIQGLAYSCLYSRFELILARLRQEQVLVAIVRMTKEGEDALPQFYRSNVPGGPLEPLTSEQVAELNSKEPVVVFEGYMKKGVEECRAEFASVGLSDWIQTQMVCEGQQFEKDFDMIFSENSAYQQIIDLMNPRVRQGLISKMTFNLIHVYLNRVGDEIAPSPESRLPIESYPLKAKKGEE